MIGMLQLRKDNITASINADNKQLVSLTKDGREYMWGGGMPAELKTNLERDLRRWQNSEILMFPVTGPSKDNLVNLTNKLYKMPQHGILRYLEKKMLDISENSIRIMQRYNGEEIETPLGKVSLPVSFSVKTEYAIDQNKLFSNFTVKNTSNKEFPYALGWHPAFVVRNYEGSFITAHASGKRYSLEEVNKASSTGTLILPYENEISYTDSDRHIRLKSNMGHSAVWSPNKDMFCIEPITALFDKEYSGYLKDKPGYKILKFDEISSYNVEIEIL